MRTIPFISIIVPVYKVEKYLENCIKSILDQTYANFELILVDDGSPDSCPIICDSYAELDSRIKVIHKKNGGLSDARNAGMEIARGDYYLFIDSDDFVFPSIVSDLVQTQIETGSELVMCQCIHCSEEDTLDTIKQPINKRTITTYSGNDKMRAYLVSNDIDTVAWKKLYARGLFEKLKFPVGKLHEDAFIMYRLIDKANIVAVTNQVEYVYRINSQSIMNSGFSLRRLDSIDAKIEQDGYIKSFHPELKRYSESGIVYACNFCLKDIACSKYNDETLRKKLQMLYRDNIRSYLSASNVSLSGKALSILAAISVSGAGTLLRFKFGGRKQ